LAWDEAPHAHGGISQQLFGQYTTDHCIKGALHRETLFCTLSSETMLQTKFFITNYQKKHGLAFKLEVFQMKTDNKYSDEEIKLVSKIANVGIKQPSKAANP